MFLQRDWIDSITLKGLAKLHKAQHNTNADVIGKLIYT
jgi:hypothetical protein